MSRHEDARYALGDLKGFLLSRGVTFRGANFRCIMPGHEDKNPSASISPDGTRWKCFACDEWGSVLDAYAIMRCMTIKDAVDDILGKANPTTYKRDKPQKEKKVMEQKNTYPDKPDSLQGDELVFQQDCSDTLYADPAEILRLARWRRWQPSTLARLATDRSIGIVPDGRLVFNYRTGMKYRNRDGDSPKVLWRKGSKQCLWRFDQMWLANPSSVYITEGETDAITLIDHGLEPEWFNRNEMLSEADVMVVALPCASYTMTWEIPFFKGLDVFIWGDPDEAGIKCLRRNAAALSGVAKSVKRAEA